MVIALMVVAATSVEARLETARQAVEESRPTREGAPDRLVLRFANEACRNWQAPPDASQEEAGHTASASSHSLKKPSIQSIKILLPFAELGRTASRSVERLQTIRLVT